MVDTQWSWRCVEDALAVCRRFEGLGLHCIEDPFLPQQWREADRPELAGFAEPIEVPPKVSVWTDDFNNLLQVLR